MSRRHRRQRRSRSSSPGPAIALAGVALIGVMGLTVFKDRTDSHPPTPTVVTATPTPPPAPSVRPPVQLRELTTLQRLAKAVGETERRMPTLRHATRGVDFETLRIELLSEASEARDELGTYLDAHPSDDRASRLWDRVLRAYVALKKL